MDGAGRSDPRCEDIGGLGGDRGVLSGAEGTAAERIKGSGSSVVVTGNCVMRGEQAEGSIALRHILFLSGLKGRSIDFRYVQNTAGGGYNWTVTENHRIFLMFRERKPS